MNLKFLPFWPKKIIGGWEVIFGSVKDRTKFFQKFRLKQIEICNLGSTSDDASN